MTIEEVAEFLKLGQRTVYEMARKGKIPVKKIANQWRFSRDRILEWVKEEVPPQKPGEDIPGTGFLIADDEEIILEILSANIENVFKGARIKTASNGIAALLAVGQFKPEYIILDINMPDMNGLEVCRLLKDDPATAHIKIFAISGMDDPALEKKCRDAGVDLFLRKTADAKDLVLKSAEKIKAGV